MRATIGALRALSWDAACGFGERLGALGYARSEFGSAWWTADRCRVPDLGPEAVVNLARESYSTSAAPSSRQHSSTSLERMDYRRW